MSTPLHAFAGAVLTGGRSRRFGRDKSLALVGGEAMAVRVAGTLTAAGAAPVFAVGGDEAALTGLGLRVVADRYPGEGPLGAIITALDAAAGRERSAELLVVLACDLVSIDSATVVALVAAMSVTSGAPDVALAVSTIVDRACAARRPEPLVGCWRVATCGPVLTRRFAAGERAVHRTVDDLAVVTVAVPADRLANVNRPGDAPPETFEPRL